MFRSGAGPQRLAAPSCGRDRDRSRLGRRPDVLRPARDDHAAAPAGDRRDRRPYPGPHPGGQSADQDPRREETDVVQASRPASGLAPGTVASVRFTDLLANGQAVGRMNGVVVFVADPLPGERASVRITQVKPKYAVGEVVAYEFESEMRAKPFCGRSEEHKSELPSR